MCEESHLVFYVLSYRPVRAANNAVWLDAYLTQLVDAVLGGLGFQLPSCGNVRNERHVEVKHILPPDIIPELPDGFKKGQAFDVTDGTTDLCDHNVHFGVPGNSCYPFLDLIGYVGDHLDCAAEVVSTTFFADDIVVDGTGSDVGIPAQILINKSLIVTEVQIGLGAVLSDENLTVFRRVRDSWDPGLGSRTCGTRPYLRPPHPGPPSRCWIGPGHRKRHPAFPDPPAEFSPSSPTPPRTLCGSL